MTHSHISTEYYGLEVPNTTRTGDTIAGWVAPDGTILICDVIAHYTMHSNMAVDIMNHFFDADYNDTNYDYDSVRHAQHDLILKGWVRLDWRKTYMPARPTPAQLKVVDAAATVWDGMDVTKYDNHFNGGGIYG